MEQLRKCHQEQCDFLNHEGCHSCPECRAPAGKINGACQKCLNCENVPGSTRWELFGKRNTKFGKLMEKEKREAHRWKMFRVYDFPPN